VMVRGVDTASATLVAFLDAVELEIVEGTKSARLRFVRDLAARAHAARLLRRLQRSGYRDRRATPREAHADR
jgi:hypothetical protein